MGKHSLTLAGPSFSVITASLVTMAGIAALIIFGSYGINVEASGQVSFRPGVYMLTSPIDGIVTTANKSGGDEVSHEEALYRITSRIMLGDEEKHQKKEVFIREKITSLIENRTNIATSMDRAKTDFLYKSALKKNELCHYQQLLITSDEKMKLAGEHHALFSKHNNKGIISKMELHEAARQLLSAKEEIQRIKVSISQVNYDIKMLRVSFDQEREAQSTQYRGYDRQLADVQQELTELMSSASADINAPFKGKLGFSSVVTGDAVKKGDVIGVVLPEARGL